MKWVMGVILFFLSITALAGHDGNGGIFVKVKGQWVQFDEAAEYLEQRYVGISELIQSDCYGHANCKQSDFGLALKDELEQFQKLDPGAYKNLITEGELVDIRLVNQELSYVPDDLPKSEIDFKEYKKAAIFRRQDGLHGTIWVSIPVMNQAGQIAEGRLTSRQNQGHLMFHELLNVVHSEKWTAQNISDYGVAVLKALYSHWDDVTFLVYLEKSGWDKFDSALPFQTAYQVVKRLDALGILYKVRPFYELSDENRELFQPALDTSFAYQQGQLPMDSIENSKMYLTNVYKILGISAALQASSLLRILGTDLPAALRSSEPAKIFELISLIDTDAGKSYDFKYPNLDRFYSQQDLMRVFQENKDALQTICDHFVTPGWRCRSDFLDSLFSTSAYIKQNWFHAYGHDANIQGQTRAWSGALNKIWKITYNGYYFVNDGSNQLIHVSIIKRWKNGELAEHDFRAAIVDPKSGRDTSKTAPPNIEIGINGDIFVPSNLIPVEKP